MTPDRFRAIVAAPGDQVPLNRVLFMTRDVKTRPVTAGK